MCNFFFFFEFLKKNSESRRVRIFTINEPKASYLNKNASLKYLPSQHLRSLPNWYKGVETTLTLATELHGISCIKSDHQD